MVSNRALINAFLMSDIPLPTTSAKRVIALRHRHGLASIIGTGRLAAIASWSTHTENRMQKYTQKPEFPNFQQKKCEDKANSKSVCRDNLGSLNYFEGWKYLSRTCFSLDINMPYS